MICHTETREKKATDNTSLILPYRFSIFSWLVHFSVLPVANGHKKRLRVKNGKYHVLFKNQKQALLLVV